MTTDVDKEGVLVALRDAFHQLKQRRSMYIGDDFDSLVAFFVGYSIAVRQSTGFDLMAEIRDWVKATYRVEFAVMWPHYLLAEISKGDEERATDLFFATVAGFTEQGAASRNRAG